MRSPTITSSLPGRNMRPAVILTCGRIASDPASMPRTVTFDDPGCPSRGLFVTTTRSALTSGLPSGPVATSLDARRISACARVIALEISLSAPLRSASALSLEPLSISAAWKPPASASAPMKIATVSPTPTAVVSVDTGRCSTLRTLYEIGIAMAGSVHAPQRIDDAQPRRLPRGDEAAHRADQQRDPDAHAHRAPVHAHRRQDAAGVESRLLDRELGADRAHRASQQRDDRRLQQH